MMEWRIHRSEDSSKFVTASSILNANREDGAGADVSGLTAGMGVAKASVLCRVELLVKCFGGQPTNQNMKNRSFQFCAVPSTEMPASAVERQATQIY